MDKIKTVKIKNLDGSVSQETYTIAVDAKNVDMDNGKDVQNTIGDIDIDNDGNISQQLKEKINQKNIIDNLETDDSNKVLSAKQGMLLNNKKFSYFLNIDSMKKAKLKNGEIVTILGYNNVGDGYSRRYEIREKLSTDIEDGYEKIFILNNLVAERIVEDFVSDSVKYIFPKFWSNARSGDCFLIKYQNKNILIDSYSLVNWNNVKNMLDENNAKHIDYFILTHYHGDHDGNLGNLMENGYIDSETKTFFPAELLTYGINNKIANAKTLCSQYNVQYNTPLENEKIEIDKEFSFTFANCDVDTIENLYTGSAKNLNSASTIVLFNHKNTKALFMADAQPSTLKYLYDIKFALTKIDLYKVEHHAINMDTYRPYIEAINPKYAVIPDGIIDFSMNNEGLCATTSLLADMNTNIFHTSNQDNYLVMESNGNTIQVLTGIQSDFNSNGDAQNIYVDSTVSTEARQDGTQNHPYKDLTTALCKIPKNSKLSFTINLADGNYGYTQTDTVFTHSKNRITIRSLGRVTIKGNQETPNAVILNGISIINSNLVLQNLTLDNRYHEGLYTYSARVQMENCIITNTNNETSSRSGMILTSNSSVSLLNVYFDYCNSCIHVRENSNITLKDITYGSHNNYIIYDRSGFINELNYPTYEKIEDKYNNINNYGNYSKPIFIYNGQNKDTDYTDSTVTLPINLNKFDTIDIQTVTKSDNRLNNTRLIKVNTLGNDMFDLCDTYKVGLNIVTVGVRIKVTDNTITYGNPFKIVTNGTTGEQTFDVSNRHIKIRYIYGYTNIPINLTQ